MKEKIIAFLLEIFILEQGAVPFFAFAALYAIAEKYLEMHNILFAIVKVLLYFLLVFAPILFVSPVDLQNFDYDNCGLVGVIVLVLKDVIAGVALYFAAKGLNTWGEKTNSKEE